MYIHFPSWISPEIIPGLPLRWYGLMYLVAFVIAYTLFTRQVRTNEFPMGDEDRINLFFWAILGLLLGARILSALLYDPTGIYWTKPWLIFWPFDSNFNFVGLRGMSYHGGLIGAVLGITLFCKKKGYSVLKVGDMLVAGIPLGYTFGRLGNFINGELYGRVTSLPWGIIFPRAERFSSDKEWVQGVASEAGMHIPEYTAMLNLPRHPSQLYEALFEGIVLWLVIWFLFRKKSPFPGFLIGVYITGYGIVRFFIEYFRQPDPGIGFPIQLGPADNPIYRLMSPINFSTGQILCLFMILTGLICIYIFSKVHKKNTDIS